MPVVVSCRTERGAPWRKHVRDRGREIVRTLALRGAELSIVLVDDGEIHDLNRRYRGRDKPTDVLSFGLEDGAPAVAGPAASLLGDVVISIDTAALVAHRRRRPMTAVLDELLVHGVLHLLGYDHETSTADARRMFRKAREVEASLTPVPRAAAPRRATSTHRRAVGDVAVATRRRSSVPHGRSRMSRTRS